MSPDSNKRFLLLICCIDCIVRTGRTVVYITAGFNTDALRRCGYGVDNGNSKQQCYARGAIAQKPHVGVFVKHESKPAEV